MKKRFLKRIGAMILVCFMVVLNLVGLIFPTSADENDSLPSSAHIYTQYENLVTKGEDLLSDVWSYLSDATVDYYGANVSLYEAPFEKIQNVPINDFMIVEAYWHGTAEEFVLKLEVESLKLYVLKNLTSIESASLVNSSDEELGPVVGRYDSTLEEKHDSYIFYTDDEFLYLRIGTYGTHVRLYEVESFDTAFDISTSSVRTDLDELFNIDLSKFSTKRVSYSRRTSPYIDFVGAYSDVVYGEWGTNSYQSGSDYLYIYDCYDESPQSGVLYYGGNSEGTVNLIKVSHINFFTKFKVESHLPRMFRISEGSNETLTKIEYIQLNYLGGDSRIYPFQNFHIITEYTNRTDWKVQKVTFSGSQKLKLDIDYTYWRQADYSTKGIGWHNQIDSIYFGVPNAILQDHRLIDAKLEYQKVTTKPIVVTQTSENINGTYVSKWFEETAQDPNNELTHNQGWVRYQKGVPYFYADPALWQKIALIDQHPTFDYQFNVRTSSPNNLYSVYWAFDVEDPTIVDKVPNPGSTTGLSSAALSDSRSTVTREELERWMVDYDLDGATTTYTAANPDYKDGSSLPETVQVNGILFDHAEPRGTYLASQVAGRVLEQYGNEDNFWKNLNVGWRYAFAHLLNTIDEQNDVVSFSKFEIHSIYEIDDENDANGDHKFAMQDMVNLQNRFRSCEASDQTLILMPFDTSQYYCAPFYGWYKEGNVDSGSEDAFNGYLAIMDMYLDLHVIELYVENAVGEIIPVEVTSNHINGIADVTHAPGSVELDHYAGETIKNKFRKAGENFWDFLKKVLVIIAIVVIILVVLRLVTWIGGRRQSNTTVVIRDDDPPRKRRWRR